MQNQLLQWAIANSNNSNSPQNTTETPPATTQTSNQDSPDWYNILIGKPDAAKLSELSKIVTNPNSQPSTKITALEDILLLVESIDNANDLKPLGIYPILISLLSLEDPQIIQLSAAIIATAVQNNPKAQSDYILIPNSVRDLLSLTSHPSLTTKSKSIYAISSLIRLNPDGLALFITLGGFSNLNSIISDIQNNIPISIQSNLLKTRIIFLLISLLQEYDSNDSIATSFNLKNEIVSSGLLETIGTSPSSSDPNATNEHDDTDENLKQLVSDFMKFFYD